MSAAKREGSAVSHRPTPKHSRIAASIAAPAVSSEAQPAANVAGIPHTMRDAERWIVWAPVPDPKHADRPHKVPVGRWRDPKYRRTYVDACAALRPGQSLGFVLGDGWAGIDVDGAWTDSKRTTMREHAREVWDACKAGYVERSPSGSGFKVFAHFDAAPADRQAVRPLPELGEHVGTEAYPTAGRWFAVTGEWMPGSGRDPDNAKARKGWRATFAALDGPVRERVRAIDPSGLADPRAVRPYTPQLEADLRAALAVLPSDDDAEWVRIGYTLKVMGWAGEHEDTAFGIWHEWSEKSAKYPGEEECRTKWQKLKPRGDVAVSAIFARAKEVARDAIGTDEKALLAELSKPIELRDYGMGEFMQIEPRERPQLVPNLLAPGLTLLFGRQKSGKTYMLLQLAVALATHGWFLGVRVAKPIRVKAYLLEEAGDPSLQRARFAEMGFDAVFCKSPQYMANLVLAFGDLPPIDKGGLQQLADDLAAFDAVLIDSATALDYGKVGRGELDVFRRHYREFSILQRAARKAKKCLFVLAHTRKGSDVSKSSPDDISDATGGKAAAIDAYWALQEEPKRGAWRLTVRGRHKASPPLALQHDKDNGHWHSLGPWDALDPAAAPLALDNEPENMPPPTIAEELALVLDLCGPALETAELVQQLRGHAESSVLAALRNMAKEGKLTRSRAAKRPGTMGRAGSVWILES